MPLDIIFSEYNYKTQYKIYDGDMLHVLNDDNKSISSCKLKLIPEINIKSTEHSFYPDYGLTAQGKLYKTYFQGKDLGSPNHTQLSLFQKSSHNFGNIDMKAFYGISWDVFAVDQNQKLYQLKQNSSWDFSDSSQWIDHQISFKIIAPGWDRDCVSLTENGDVFYWKFGPEKVDFLKIEAFNKIINISAVDCLYYALNQNNELFECWFHNKTTTHGAKILNNVKLMSTGKYFLIAATHDNAVFFDGYSDGMLNKNCFIRTNGVEKIANQNIVFLKVYNNTCIALNDRDEVLVMGNRDFQRRLNCRDGLTVLEPLSPFHTKLIEVVRKLAKESIELAKMESNKPRTFPANLFDARLAPNNCVKENTTQIKSKDHNYKAKESNCVENSLRNFQPTKKDTIEKKLEISFFDKDKNSLARENNLKKRKLELEYLNEKQKQQKDLNQQKVKLYEEAIEENLICPITNERFTDPVLTPDFHTYERSAIIEWLKKNNTSPVTSEQLLTPSILKAHNNVRTDAINSLLKPNYILNNYLDSLKKIQSDNKNLSEEHKEIIFSARRFQ